jgi:hypothetical protein
VGCVRLGATVVAALTAPMLTGCGGGAGPGSVSTSAGRAMTWAKLAPLATSPESVRWRDATGLRDVASLYSDGFRAVFSYADLDDSYAGLNIVGGGAAFAGTVKAVRLKPSMAYQMKLEGKARITSAMEAPSPAADPEGWASWQIGHCGRWWCSTCSANVSDGALDWHVSRGDYVSGYLLFGFFMTGRNGCARQAFALDSSYHVLWRTDQRKRSSADSRVAYYLANRGAWGYGLSADEPGPLVALFAEGEPGRPAPGALVLPPGTYPVQFRLTEESFHESGDYCGTWPAVLGADISFSITGADATRIAGTGRVP